MLIVKKMPILQGFPDFETVKNLSGNATENVNFSPLFYDIETTGLGRNSSFLYLIGAVCYESGSWQLYQWLAPDFREEKALLEVFSEFIKNFSCTIQYKEILLSSLTFRLVINSMSYQILLRGFLLLTCIKCFAL